MKVVYLIMLLCIGHIYSMAQQKAEKIDSPFDNLYKVSDSIFRSEQPDSLGVVFLQENGFKSILNIKTRQTDAAFDTEGIHLYHVKMRAECLKDKKVIEALQILRDAPKPVVVHCHYGADRTGLIVALYRIIYQGYSKEEAIEELKFGGFGFHRFLWNIPKYIKKADIEKLRLQLEES